jgi:transcriptional antiterminator RfaH
LLKVSENPPIIWPEDKPICQFKGQWWVAHTKSRNEKALAHDLVSKHVSYFLPMAWKTSHTRGRKTKSLLPIFSGYLFFCGDENDRLNVLKTNRTASLIEVVDQQTFLKQISQIECAIKSGAAISQHKHIKQGQKCQVLSGSLKGLLGIVDKSKNETRLILQIDMLGQAASVEIDYDLIEPIEQ